MSTTQITIIIAVISVASLAATVFALPKVVAEFPPDLLTREEPWRPPSHPLRTALGVLLLLAGVAMLVLPGQGILTIVAGLALVNFPGKVKMLKRMLRSGKVRRAVNALRARAGCAPLEPPPPRADDS